jgi:hypothetical protein
VKAAASGTGPTNALHSDSVFARIGVMIGCADGSGGRGKKLVSRQLSAISHQPSAPPVNEFTGYAKEVH